MKLYLIATLLSATATFIFGLLGFHIASIISFFNCVIYAGLTIIEQNEMEKREKKLQQKLDNLINSQN